jgi:hypothetical protein
VDCVDRTQRTTIEEIPNPRKEIRSYLHFDNQYLHKKEEEGMMKVVK